MAIYLDLTKKGQMYFSIEQKQGETHSETVQN